MIADKDGKFVPSTYCHPQQRPKYETEQEDVDEVCIEDLEMLEDGDEAGGEKQRKWLMKDLVDLQFGMEESTLSMLVSVRLNPDGWRAIQEDLGTSDVFA